MVTPCLKNFFQVSKAELDLENILKQITPETHDAEISSDKNIERLRRQDDVISDEMRNVINNLPANDESKVTAEKRDSDTEEKKKFSVVKVPDIASKQNQIAAKLNTIPSDEEAAGSGSGSDSESGSGSDSESGDTESESSEKRSNMMTKNEATLAMNIEGDDGSGSGSGDDSSSAGGVDSNASKRNLMESSPLKNGTQNTVTNGTNNIELPAVIINGNVSQANTLNPGGFNEAPMSKTESTKVDGNATLKEITYFKPQENTTEVIDRVNNNNATKVNQNTTFTKVLNNAPGNNTKQGNKRDSLPDEVSNVADNLFNFENDDEGKSPATASASANGNAESSDDSLPGSQGGPIAEDLMSSMTSPIDKKSVISNVTTSPVKTEQITGEKKAKVVNPSEASSGSGGSVPDDEIKMQVESSIGKSFDASMKRMTDNMEAELLPGDYGDDSLSLSDLSGSGSGMESGDDQESGSGDAETENLLLDSSKKSTIKPKNNTLVEPESDLGASDESGDAESGSGSGASGSGSGDFDNILSTNQGEAAGAESSPFGLHAIEATSSMKPIKSFRHNMTSSTNLKNSSLHNFFEPESDTQSFLGETDEDSDSNSGSGESESGDDSSGESESGVSEDDEGPLKPSIKTEENPFAKDQVAGQEQSIPQAKDTMGE